MKILASDFIVKRDFYSYTYQPKENTNTISEVKDALLEKNTEFTASFFPEESYVFKVKGEGFKRNQIRLMMGALIDIGKNKMSTSLFKETLNGSNKIKLDHIAPASGLVLHEVVIFDK